MTNSAARLLVIKDEDAFDMSGLVSNITWSGRRGAAARTLSITLIDDDGYAHDRAGIDVEMGHQCVFYWENVELFRGMFMSEEQSQSKTMRVKAYDNGIYLANNRDTFNYADKKASEIFSDCCQRFGIPTGTVADTGYRVPELPKPKTTAWDVIGDALNLTFMSTGRRYYPMSKDGKLSLIERRENILQWVIETGVNLEGYSRTKSIEKIKTRVKLLSKEGTVLAEATDAELEKRIGIFSDIISKTDEMNKGQLNEAAAGALRENNRATDSFTVTALGLPDVITGMGVFVVIKPLGISKTFYVEEDTHTFNGRHHTMTLKLSTAFDIVK